MLSDTAIVLIALGGLTFLFLTMIWVSSQKRELEESEFNRKLREELDRRQNALQQRIQALQYEQELFARTREEFNAGLIRGRRWLAAFIAEADQASDNRMYGYLINKDRPAYKAAEAVAKVTAEKRNWKEKAKYLEYQLLSYKEYFPFLEDYEEAILDEAIPVSPDGETQEVASRTDPVHRYLSKEEYEALSETERYQLALDRYLNSSLSPAAIGRLYERYLGARYEANGYSVEYHGILKGLEDLGRDLICKRGNEVIIVQAKCWAASKTIHEKHIFQLFGTTMLYRLRATSRSNVTPCFYTTTKLSDVARAAADALQIEVNEQFALCWDFPLIKCNINRSTGERIYHLPFDQQYERTVIDKSNGECFATTVFEAESMGFRRARRYFGPGA